MLFEYQFHHVDAYNFGIPEFVNVSSALFDISILDNKLKLCDMVALFLLISEK